MYIRQKLLQSRAAFSGAISPNRYAKNKGSLVHFIHFPSRFSRRSETLTANVCGILSPEVSLARYKLNNSGWEVIIQQEPRVPPPLFTIELKYRELLEGSNTLVIQVVTRKGKTKKFSRDFLYDSSPISLPQEITWSQNSELEVQDGYWETFESNGNWRVRPKPNFEGYDRILNVTGTITGGRRVETDLTYQYPGWLGFSGRRAYGFGILTMWGGHPDEPGIYPRRGWAFGLSWFLAPRRSRNPLPIGLRSDFSYKYGRPPQEKNYSFHSFRPKKGVRYRVISECFQEVNHLGEHLHHRQRLKWWTDGEPEPKEWLLDTTDEFEGKDGIRRTLLEPGDYSVALVTHRAQVDFGSIKVSPIEPMVVDS